MSKVASIQTSGKPAVQAANGKSAPIPAVTPIPAKPAGKVAPRKSAAAAKAPVSAPKSVAAKTKSANAAAGARSTGAKSVAAKTVPTTAAAKPVIVKRSAVKTKGGAASVKPVAAKPGAKSVASKPVPSKPVAARTVAKAPAKVDVAAAVKDKARKPKLVRDSFTMPEQEYAVIGQVKKACLKAGFEIKKSELLRIGVALISQIDRATLQSVLSALPQLKTGRPKKI